MRKIKRYLEDTPNYIINAITIISFVIMPLSFLGQLILIWLGKIDKYNFSWLNFSIIAAVIIILLARIKKYHTLLHNRMKTVSMNLSNFLKYSQSVYFDIMKLHKHHKLSVELLTDKYKNELIKILNCLCEIMESYTGREISSCIKIINYDNPNNIIDLENATVSTFCRSQNSIGRGEYEKKNEPIYIKKNTDFLEIVDEKINTGKPYFYVQDLKKYDAFLKKHTNRRYENSNPNYSDSYNGTVVMPIRIESEKLYDISKKEKYNIVGFLCVDSLSTDAFLPKQEVFNCKIIQAFADNIYVLLGQYAHYLKDFTKDIDTTS